MFVGASPDARLVSPWQTPRSGTFLAVSSGRRIVIIFSILFFFHIYISADIGYIIGKGAYASPWDHVSPSPVPIRASGSSVRSSNSRYERSSYKGRHSTGDAQRSEVCYFELSVFMFDNREIQLWTVLDVLDLYQHLLFLVFCSLGFSHFIHLLYIALLILGYGC